MVPRLSPGNIQFFPFAVQVFRQAKIHPLPKNLRASMLFLKANPRTRL
jgi:hypothetical protein